MLEQIFSGTAGTSDRIDRILASIKRLQEIDSAISTIRYNDELLQEVPEVFKLLGAAKDAVTAELKTI